MKKLLLAILAIGSVGSTLCDEVVVKTNSNTGKKYLTKRITPQPRLIHEWILDQQQSAETNNRETESVQYNGNTYTLNKQCYNAGCGATNCPWYYHNPQAPQCKAVMTNPFYFNYTELN